MPETHLTASLASHAQADQRTAMNPFNLDSAVGRARVGCWGRVRSRRDNAAGSCLQDGATTPGASSVAQSGA